MNIIRKSDKKRRRVAAIGMWDGVHRGHRFLIDYLTLEARARGLAATVVTFTDHPRRLVNPESSPMMLDTLDDRLDRLSEAGVDDVVLLEFNKSLRRSTARRFLERLHKSYGIDVLVVGFNNRFGHNRKDGIEDYRRIGDDIGLEIVEAPEYRGSGTHVSSSVIREHLLAGRPEKAAELLGRPFTLRGIVVEGKRLGRQLGFPTANLKPSSSLTIIPGPGVYAGHVTTPDGARRPAVVNVGFRPTVDNSLLVSPDLSIEVHIPDFSGYLYDDEIAVEFAKRLRDERRFKDLDKLRRAIADDVSHLRRWAEGLKA